MGRGRERVIRLLLCDSLGQSELTSDDGEVVHSPLQCLDKAVDGNPEIIVVRFGEMPIWEREALVELCATLKRNSHTQRIPLLALLPVNHRGLMEELARAGVDFIKVISQVIGEATLSLTLIREIIEALGADDRAERQLAMVCPYLHYTIIGVRHEMTLCGAYLDRMVLGGHQLHDVCETGNHLQCESFLNPRLKSARSVHPQD